MEKITAAQFRLMVAKPAKMPRAHKYGAKARTVDGHRFPSRSEAARYEQLKLLRRAGSIRDLELQPRFVLCPATAIERAMVYVADFAYLELQAGRWVPVVEDVKGHPTEAYKLKRKLFRQSRPDIDFREIRRR